MPFSEIETVDLKQHPQECRVNSGQEEITLGDLHANAMKLIFFLLKEGVIALENGKEDYEKLWAIYDKDPVTKKDCEQFRETLSEVSIQSKPALIRLIGDELSDRGNNDIFVIYVLSMLDTKGINFEILASNHGFNFLTFFNNVASQFATGELQKGVQAKKSTKDQLFKASLSNCLMNESNERQILSSKKFYDLFINGVLSNEDFSSIKKFINNGYKKKLKLVSYTLSPNDNQKPTASESSWRDKS